MAGSSYNFDSSRAGIDGAGAITWPDSCGTSLTNWSKDDKAIIAVFVTDDSHTPPSESFKLRWRNVTDSGSFADLTDSGELQAGASAGCISNTDPVGGSAGCQGSTDASEEIENESPLQSASLACSQNGYIELQFCADFGSALDGKEYAFEIYSATESASISALDITITTESFGRTTKNTDSNPLGSEYGMSYRMT